MSDTEDLEITFAQSFFHDEGVDCLFPRFVRKYKAAKKLRDILDRCGSWWKYSVYSPREWKYRLKMKFFTKPNKVHVKYFSDYFWVDRCSLIRHCVMQILVDFVEKEDPFNHFDTEDSYHKEQWDELRALYEWYKNFKEFDSHEYQMKLLGYDPYSKPSKKPEFVPIEKYGVDDWGDANMYSWDLDSTEEETKALLESMEKEKEFEDDFTRRAMRVVELWRMLWT